MTGSLDDITVTVDEAALEKAVAGLSLMETSALKVADEIAGVARGTAPVGGDGDPHSGDYRDGIITQPFKGGARVFATDYKSAWIEFGVPSRGIPATFNLRNAAVSLNLKFKKTSHG